MLQFLRSLRCAQGSKPYQPSCGAHPAAEGSRRVPAAIVPAAAAKHDGCTDTFGHYTTIETHCSTVCGSRRSVLLSHFGLVPLALLVEAAAQPGAAAAAAAGWPFGAFKAPISSNTDNAAELAASSRPDQQPLEPVAGADPTADEGSSDDEDGSSSSSSSSDDEPVDSIDGEDIDSSSSSSSSSVEEQAPTGSASDQQQDPPRSSGLDSDTNNNTSNSSNNSSSSSASNTESSSGSGSGSNISSGSSSSEPSSINSKGSSAATDSSSSSSSSSGSSAKAGKGNVSANLSVNSYLQILRDARKASWPLIAQKIGAGDWIELSQVLVQPPFDDVRQACFYIPWALLQSDDFAAAVTARKEYVEFIDHVHALATIALKAADGQPGADMQVQQSFMLLNASVESYLAAVPPKYNKARA